MLFTGLPITLPARIKTRFSAKKLVEDIVLFIADIYHCRRLFNGCSGTPHFE